MKIETLKHSHLKRNIIIGLVVVLVISAIVLNFTRAKYRVTESIPLVNGTINYSLADLNVVALYINGVEAEELVSTKSYTLDTTQSTCTYKDGTTIDSLTLSYDSSTKAFSISPYTTKGTKCTLYFDEVKNASETIEDLYPDNQGILAYDDYGNLRYIGADPNNYVLFNDELWRIIGIFSEDTHGVKGKKLIKIIRDESLGNFFWDDKPMGTGSATSHDGSNNWSDSTLQVVLNSGAYWNRTSGSCPNGFIGENNNCDFSTNGLTTTAKEMIEIVTWKLGGVSDSNSNTAIASEWYNYERGTEVYSGNPTTWSGKVALIYPSDYGYATSGDATTNREICLATELNNWVAFDVRGCLDNDWLFNNSNDQWLLTPFLNDIDVYSLSSAGYVVYNRAYYYEDPYMKRMVRPSVYLKSSVSVIGGTGSSSDPFILSGN